MISGVYKARDDSCQQWIQKLACIIKFGLSSPEYQFHEKWLLIGFSPYMTPERGKLVLKTKKILDISPVLSGCGH